MDVENKRGSVFINIIAIMGAVLILVGVAWLIAKNWHQIPDILKVAILVFATLLAFGSGVFARSQNHEGTGRALIVLGAGLYLLSLFLISQIYHLATTLQHFAWLLLLGWSVILLTAYLLKSPENVVVTTLVFFVWIVVQYLSSIYGLSLSDEGGLVLGFVLLFLSAGVLLYSSSIFHNSINHPFTNIYRFWTVVYFLLIFYVLSFQAALPIIGGYSFGGEVFTFFLISFILISLLSFVLGILFATSKKVISIKEILIFIGILVVIFGIVMATKPISGVMGTCYAKNCYDFASTSDCESATAQLNCEWIGNSCERSSCYRYETESQCNSASEKLNCEWKNDRCDEFNCYSLLNESACVSVDKNCTWGDGRCSPEIQPVIERGESSLHDMCTEHNNQKESCLDNDECKWNISFNIRGKLPLSLWFLWAIVNALFIGFIVLVLGYGQSIGSNKIINLGMGFFILEIISRYIGFWMDFQGYLAFSILAILGGVLLILGSWLIPKWRKNLIKESPPQQKQVQQTEWTNQ